MRDLAGGKPIGLKLCVGHPWEFFAIAKAFKATGTTAGACGGDLL
jgi:hypothetical protein